MLIMNINYLTMALFSKLRGLPTSVSNACAEAFKTSRHAVHSMWSTCNVHNKIFNLYNKDPKNTIFNEMNICHCWLAGLTYPPPTAAAVVRTMTAWSLFSDISITKVYCWALLSCLQYVTLTWEETPTGLSISLSYLLCQCICISLYSAFSEARCVHFG